MSINSIKSNTLKNIQTIYSFDWIKNIFKKKSIKRTHSQQLKYIKNKQKRQNNKITTMRVMFWGSL